MQYTETKENTLIQRETTTRSFIMGDQHRNQNTRGMEGCVVHNHYGGTYYFYNYPQPPTTPIVPNDNGRKIIVSGAYTPEKMHEFEKFGTVTGMTCSGAFFIIEYNLTESAMEARRVMDKTRLNGELLQISIV